MDRVIVNGKETRPPRFYDRLLEKADRSTFEQVKITRENNGYRYVDDVLSDGRRVRVSDSSGMRLLVKEVVKKAEISTLVRPLESLIVKVNLYSIFDSKLATYGKPWYELTDAAAIRAFADAVADSSNPNNQYNKHPEDFSLYVLGSFDDQTAVFKTCAPISLQTASALFASRNVDKHIEHPFDFSK